MRRVIATSAHSSAGPGNFRAPYGVGISIVSPQFRPGIFLNDATHAEYRSSQVFPSASRSLHAAFTDHTSALEPALLIGPLAAIESASGDSSRTFTSSSVETEQATSGRK